MGRFSSFFLGMIVGAALLGAAMSYHFVRTEKGLIMVPKISKSLADPFVDVRTFTLADWQQHRALAAALVQSDKSELFADTSLANFKTSIEGVIEGLFGSGS